MKHTETKPPPRNKTRLDRSSKQARQV